MQPLGDKTVIRHTYDNTKATGLFDEVYVVTDSEIIFNEIVNNDVVNDDPVFNFKYGFNPLRYLATSPPPIPVCVQTQSPSPVMVPELQPQPASRSSRDLSDSDLAGNGERP
jgi:hypothetical protein